MMTSDRSAVVYTGRLERDARGRLWAVLYLGDSPTPDAVIARQAVRSVRTGKRVVAQLVIGNAEADRKKRRWPWTRPQFSPDPPLNGSATPP